MNITTIIGDVQAHLENGEKIIITGNQINDLITENEQLRKLNQTLTEQIKTIRQAIDENSLEVSESKIQELMEELGV